jgi:NADPH:quinone reductase-like Zn-dependent oxidoreductase
MKACVLRKDDVSLDGIEIVERPDPVPGRNDVVVRIRAASLNFRDYLIVSDNYSTAKMEDDLVLLSDGAGEVVATGANVSRFQVGDRVAGTFFQTWREGPMKELPPALGLPLPGVLSELVVLHEDGVVDIPANLSFEEASTLPCAGLTAWNATMVSGRSVKPGDTVLCQGSGGVSLFTALFAKAAGARVILMSSSEKKLQRARHFLPGIKAEDCIDYVATPDWHDEVMRITGGRGADHVMELGGAATLSRSYAALAFGGRIALIGFRPDATGDCNPCTLMMKDGHIDGVGVGNALMFENMNRAIRENGIKPPVERVFAMDEIVDALKLMASRDFVGKIVVRV